MTGKETSGVPFLRVLKQPEAGAFATLGGGWLAEQEIAALARLAGDAKVLRGSSRHDGKPLQMLSVVTHHLRLTLDQIPIAAKSNEIPALLGISNLKSQISKPPPGRLLTADLSACPAQAGALHGSRPAHGASRWIWAAIISSAYQATRSGSPKSPEPLLVQQGFPPQGQWEKGHGRLDLVPITEQVGQPQLTDLAHPQAGGIRGHEQSTVLAIEFWPLQEPLQLLHAVNLGAEDGLLHARQRFLDGLRGAMQHVPEKEAQGTDSHDEGTDGQLPDPQQMQ